MLNRTAFLLVLLSTFTFNSFRHPTLAEDGVLERLEEAKSELTQSKYRLQYKFQPGETIQYSIEHLVSIDTTIEGNNQKTKLRTKSIRSIQVEDVSRDGNMRFVHVVDSVDMWSEVDGREAVHFDSNQTDPPPPEYEHVADNIGKPISVITINPAGKVVSRQDKIQHPNLGLGGITIPMPEQKIAVGFSWSQPLELKVRVEDRRIKQIKTRELYRLEKVETGIATISVKTQILTPIDDPRIKSQIVQRISEGEIRFDLDAGRLISKKLEWDESVLGFNGAASNMKYLAKFTEQLRDTKTARKTGQDKS